MKWFAPFALMIPSACALAQSSIEIYGITDAGINYLSNAQTGKVGGRPTGIARWAFYDGSVGGQQGSRLGVRGFEDLGGGYKALIRLENGFSLQNGAAGQGGAIFGREAWTGIQAPYGQITLGRQYSAIVQFYAPNLAAQQWAGYMSAHPGDLDDASKTWRINNSLKYTSPVISGWQFGGVIGREGNSGQPGSDTVWSIGAAFQDEGLRFGAGFLDADKPNTSFFGSNVNSAGALTNNMGSTGSLNSAENNPVFGGYASARSLRILAIAASYTHNPATVTLAYSRTSFVGLGSNAGPNSFRYTGTATFDDVELSGLYQMTSRFDVGTEVNYLRGGSVDGKNDARYATASVGVMYFLSKSTDLYSLVVGEKATGTDSFDQPSVAAITGMTPSSSSFQLAVRIGMKHTF
ncbi:porin [Paraburkholderia bannensis]|uniref:porin n=1 Tax=Paraburkholderia bannensis TaxID=765414 RepID=UPI002AB618CE|nr:porin [Paraburkholderia bannensis]